METKTEEEIKDMIDDDIMIIEDEKGDSKIENVEDVLNDVEIKEEEIPKRKDPTPAEMKDYFKKVDDRKKWLTLNKDGAKEFEFEDGFTCIARDQRNADRKHNNWINGKG